MCGGGNFDVDDQRGQSGWIGENQTISVEGGNGKCDFGKMRDFYVENGG